MRLLGVRFDRDTSMRWLMMEDLGGFIRQVPLAYDSQDRRVRLRASVRCGKGPLTIGSVAEARARNKLKTERICFDETP